MSNKYEKYNNEPWLKWAIQIQSIAQNGLAYCEDEFDRERYKQLREISAEMMSYKTGISTEKVKSVFCCEAGYQTPKIVTRAAIFKDNKILLVRESNGKWSLPGGWCDVFESVESNTVKEVKEESGLDVKVRKIIALQDRNKNNKPFLAFGVCKVFSLCDYIRGDFVENSETKESDYFGLDELPELDDNRTTVEQVKMCFEANNDPNWKTLFD